MAHYLDALENAIRDHRVTGYRPTDTTDIYRAIGTLGVIVQTLSHLIFQVKLGLAELPAADEGLRTDTIAGDLDPDATGVVPSDAAHSLLLRSVDCCCRPSPRTSKT